MTHISSNASPQGGKRIPQAEFVALMAVLMSCVAFAIDSMLPSLPRIAEELTPDAPNNAQLVVGIFMLGMGIGTFFTGPLSDAVGRKPVIVVGSAIYVAGAMVGAISNDLSLLLAGRFLQGLGAAGARTVPMALIRDLYVGEKMAKITSIIMMFFIVVPALAPAMGGLIAMSFGWRGVFIAFMIFGSFGALWLWFRQPETLPVEHRRPFVLPELFSGAKIVLGNRDFRLYTLALGLGFGQMFAMLSTAKQLYAVYGVGETFVLWFGAAAVISGVSSAFNAVFVTRFGMLRIARTAFAGQIVASLIVFGLELSGIGTGWGGLIMLFLWCCSIVLIAGASFGNLNALAMQPMGELAGMASSVLTAISTIMAVLIAVPVGLLFNETPYPLVCATLACSGLSLVLLGMVTKPRDRLENQV